MPAGRIFTSFGQPARVRGVSAFPFFDRLAKGEDVTGWMQPFIDLQFNWLRIWPYVPVADWKDTAWNWPDISTVTDGIALANEHGFAVEVTLLLDDDPVNIPKARALVESLSAHKDDLSFTFEIGNEPRTHKHIDCAALKSTCEQSGVPFSSGIYENPSEAFGSYLTAHPGGDSEWPRRVHDLLEFYNGGGPKEESDPPHHCPCVADETQRPDNAGYNEQDYLAFFAAASLLGAGSVFHFQGGKYLTPMTPDEQRCCEAAAKGLLAFPADAPLGPYSRPDEGGATLRTYQVGPYTVRIRPTDGRVLP